MEIITVVGGNLQTNCYIIHKDSKAILFDFVPEVEKELKIKNLSLEKIFLTHIHFDHFELLFDFQKRFDFELYLSEKSFKNINNKSYNLLNTIPEAICQFIDDVNLSKAKILNDGDIVEWNGINVESMSTPGHSEDSVVYIVDKERVAFVGDTVFYCSIGRTDLPGSEHNKILKSIEKLFNRITDDYILYPGHGPFTNVDFEKKNNYFLKKGGYDIEL